MDQQWERVEHRDGTIFLPQRTSQTFLVRVWRNAVSDGWHYTVVIPNVEKRHHFHSSTDAAQFIDSIMQY